MDLADVQQPIAVPPPAGPAAQPPLAPPPLAPPSLAPLAQPGRRGFLKWVLGFSVLSTIGMVVAPVVGFLVPPKSATAGAGGKVLAGTTTDIPVGQGKVVAMGSTPVIVTDTSQGVHAFSAVCTHLGCIVSYDSANSLIICPCHGGQFNPSTGAVVGGPPPAPLKPVTVSVEKDQIFLVNG